MIRFFILALFCAQTAHAAGDPVVGKQAFLKCASCHQIGSPHSGFGPHLRGIVDRPAAAATDFKYSAAMRNSRIVWTEVNLRAFLKTPDKVVPGNAMRFTEIGSDREIDDLLAYLRTRQ